MFLPLVVVGMTALSFCDLTMVASSTTTPDVQKIATYPTSTQQQPTVRTNPSPMDTVPSKIVEELMSGTGSNRRYHHHDSMDDDVRRFPSPELLPFHGQGRGAISTHISLQCWQSGISLIQQLSTTSSSSSSSFFETTTNAVSFCNNLTELQWKRFILEITYCHMQDVGGNNKPMYQSTDLQNKCTSAAVYSDLYDETTTIQMCLHHLTDLGYHTYTYFVPYIEMICQHKTNEIFRQNQQDYMNEVTNNYIKMTTQSTEQLHTQTEQVQNLLHTIIPEQLSIILQHQFHTTQTELDSLVQNHVKIWDDHLTEVMDRMDIHEIEYHNQIDHWMQYISSRLLEQSHIMEYQHELMNHHVDNMVTKLSNTITETKQQLQPIIQLQSIMTVAKYSYHWISFLLYFIATINIVWIMTRFSQCHSFRLYLFGVVWIEAILEILLVTIMENNMFLPEQEKNTDRSFYTTELRHWAITIEVVIYVFGMVMSFFHSFVFVPIQKYRGRRQAWCDDTGTYNDEVIQQQQDALQDYLLLRHQVVNTQPLTIKNTPSVEMVRNCNPLHQIDQLPLTATRQSNPVEIQQQCHNTMNHANSSITGLYPLDASIATTTMSPATLLSDCTTVTTELKDSSTTVHHSITPMNTTGELFEKRPLPVALIWNTCSSNVQVQNGTQQPFDCSSAPTTIGSNKMEILYSYNDDEDDDNNDHLVLDPSLSTTRKRSAMELPPQPNMDDTTTMDDDKNANRPPNPKRLHRSITLAGEPVEHVYAGKNIREA